MTTLQAPSTLSREKEITSLSSHPERSFLDVIINVGNFFGLDLPKKQGLIIIAGLIVLAPIVLLFLTFRLRRYEENSWTVLLTLLYALVLIGVFVYLYSTARRVIDFLPF